MMFKIDIVESESILKVGARVPQSALALLVLKIFHNTLMKDPMIHVK